MTAFVAKWWHMARPRKSPHTINCQNCNRPFHHDPNNPRTTCCNDCATQLRIKRLTGRKRPGIGGPERKSARFLVCCVCGKEFFVTPTQASRIKKTCSKECRGKYMKAIKSLHKVRIVCQRCGEPFDAPACHAKRNRRFCSDACRMAWFNEYSAQEQRGRDNPNWRGGGSLEYYGPTWPQAKRSALKRDGSSCVICGKTSKELGYKPVVHHVVPFKWFDSYEEANLLENLMCLCRGCHMSKENYISKLIAINT